MPNDDMKWPSPCAKHRDRLHAGPDTQNPDGRQRDDRQRRLDHHAAVADPVG
jgi:hypothetical protein